MRSTGTSHRTAQCQTWDAGHLSCVVSLFNGRREQNKCDHNDIRGSVVFSRSVGEYHTQRYQVKQKQSRQDIGSQLLHRGFSQRLVSVSRRHPYRGWRDGVWRATGPAPAAGGAGSPVEQLRRAHFIHPRQVHPASRERENASPARKQRSPERIWRRIAVFSRGRSSCLETLH